MDWVLNGLGLDVLFFGPDLNVDLDLILHRCGLGRTNSVVSETPRYFLPFCEKCDQGVFCDNFQHLEGPLLPFFQNIS